MNVIKCDYCGEKIFDEEKDKFLMPVMSKIVARGGNQNKIICEIDGITQKKEQDICFRCQDKIARFCNMLSYVDINMDKIELDIFNKFKKGAVNSIKNNMENK